MKWIGVQVSIRLWMWYNPRNIACYVSSHEIQLIEVAYDAVYAVWTPVMPLMVEAVIMFLRSRCLSSNWCSVEPVMQLISADECHGVNKV